MGRGAGKKMSKKQIQERNLVAQIMVIVNETKIVRVFSGCNV